jgi:hypothetical protein
MHICLYAIAKKHLLLKAHCTYINIMKLIKKIKKSTKKKNQELPIMKALRTPVKIYGKFKI